MSPASPPIDWTSTFLSATGRTPRAPFVVAAVVLLGVATLYEAVVGDTLHWLTGWFVYPALIYCGVCALSKRLHDRGRTGWWAALVMFAIVACWPRPEGFFDFLFALVLLWAVVELGVMPGEDGVNRYGANPLRPVVAV